MSWLESEDVQRTLARVHAVVSGTDSFLGSRVDNGGRQPVVMTDPTRTDTGA